VRGPRRLLERPLGERRSLEAGGVWPDDREAERESQPETILSVRVSDAAGQTQTLTLVGFERDWQAEHAKDEGVPGFVVRNWLFVGVVTAPDIQARIEGTLL
jgi:hypothetical protein